MGFECTKCGTDNGLTFTCGMKCKECGKVMDVILRGARIK